MQHRRNRSRLIPVATALTALATATVSLYAQAAQAAPRRPVAHLTDAAIAAMPPAKQATLLQPLRRLAGDLDAVGRAARWSASYSGVALEASSGIVNLYATNVAAARHIIAEARGGDPHAAWNDVRTRPAAYSAGHLNAAVRALINDPHRPAQLTSIAVPVDGSGLTVNVGSAALTSVRAPTLPASSTVDGVPVHVDFEAAHHQKSWAAVKWEDSTPFIGGDVLTTGRGGCTAGLPAVKSDGQPVMITAAHCFALGTRVYTGAGTPGDYYNGLVGHYVGTVTARNTTWDAEELIGANNNADESDTSGWIPLTSVAYSYVGDYVCQNGAASFYLGHPTPCGIRVTNQDLWFPIGGHWARGVQGVDVVNGWGSHDGDSGGTVFAVERGGVRQARGIISSGGADGTPEQKVVDWTEAVDIFHAFGLKLNPQT